MGVRRRGRRAAVAVLFIVLFAAHGCGRPPPVRPAPPPRPAVPEPGVPGPAVPEPGVPGPGVPGPGVPGPGVRPPHQLAGALHGRSAARFTVGDAAARVRLRVTDLPGQLYRVNTPAGSGFAPWITGGDAAVRLDLRATGDDGPDTVDVLLNRAVRWQIRLLAGAGEQHLDLRAARLTAVDVGAGVGLLRVRLPRPQGTVAVRVTGTVGSAEFHVPHGVPVGVRAAAGVAVVSLPGLVRVAAPAGSTWAPDGWTTAPGRYRLTTRAHVGTLTVGP